MEFDIPASSELTLLPHPRLHGVCKIVKADGGDVSMDPQYHKSVSSNFYKPNVVPLNDPKISTKYISRTPISINKKQMKHAKRSESKY